MAIARACKHQDFVFWSPTLRVKATVRESDKAPFKVDDEVASNVDRTKFVISLAPSCHLPADRANRRHRTKSKVVSMLTLKLCYLQICFNL